MMVSRRKAQANAWADVGPDICFHMSSLIHNWLILFVSLLTHFFWLIWSHTPALTNHKYSLPSYICSITPGFASSTVQQCNNSIIHLRGPDSWWCCPDCSSCSHWSFVVAVLWINPNIWSEWYELNKMYITLQLLVIWLCSPSLWHHDCHIR